VQQVWRCFAAFDFVLVLLGIGLFVAVLASGELLLSIAVLGAVVLRVLMWRHASAQAARSKRHRELRRRRLERERAGQAPRRD
jgi:hypothetical protein